MPVRCDNDTKGMSTPGCVFKDYAPVNVVSLSGLYHNHARHIHDAQASGLPGAYPDGQPLPRQTDDTTITSNRRTACPQASGGGYPRPTGYSCDGYPFASTIKAPPATRCSAGPSTGARSAPSPAAPSPAGAPA
ncbi:hypothetical protein I3F60_29605 [Streptomyces sp. MUM 136J]|nr:hypothetical protein [Streptomyces sp. MUM 136J]